MSAAPRSVFISFTPADRAAAQRIHDALAGRGFATWMAPADLTGDDLHGAVLRALGSSTDMVFVFSAATNASEDAKRELALASQRRLTIIPVKVDGVQPSDHFAYELATANWIDASQNFDGALNQIAAVVGASGMAAPATSYASAPVMASPVAAAPVPPPVAPVQPQVVYAPYPQPKPRSHVLRHVIVTIIVLIVLLFGGLFTWGYFKVQDTEAHMLPCRSSADLDAKIAACSAVADDKFTEAEYRRHAHEFRGKAYLLKKDFAKATADFDWIIANNGNDYANYYYRSLAERGAGNTTAADADLALATSHGFKPTDADLTLAPDSAAPVSTPAETPPASTTPTEPPAETPPATPAPEQPSGNADSPDQPTGDTGTTAPTPSQTPADDGTGDQTSGEGRHHN